MSPVAAPADRRFRRAHVKPVRKRHGWRTFVRPAAQYGVIALIGLYGAYYGAGAVTHANVLRVDRVVISGNERLSKGELMALLTGLQGENLLWTDLDVWRQRLLVSPWVRDASIRRSFPSTVDVVVSERRPMGVGRIDGAMYLIDDQGVIIDQFGPQYADLDLPIVDGLSVAPDDNGSVNDRARAALAGRVIAAVAANPTLAHRLSQIDVSDVYNAAVILSGDTTVIHLGEERFLARLQSYLELAPTLHERVAAIEYVDLRLDDRIYVRPVGSADRTDRKRSAAGNQGKQGRR